MNLGISLSVEKDVNYQELANEKLFEHKFGVCDELPPKSNLRQRFYRGDWFPGAEIFVHWRCWI